MPRYPGATWRPLTVNYTKQKTTKHRVILHTSASATAASLHGWFSTPAAASSSHFHVADDGSVEQYIDTDHVSWASGNGNADSISVETQGDGTKPWTSAQGEAIVALLVWAHKTHGVPLTQMQSSKAGTKGIGWHRLGVDGEFPALPSILAGRPQRGGGESWSRARGKTCPGDDRIQQIPNIIAAAKAALPRKDSTMTPLLTNQQWRDDVQGRRIVWGVNGAQCVDLMKDKAIRAHGAPKGAYGNGLDMAQGLSRLEGWTYHRIGSTELEDGDIVSGEAGDPWHKRFGHVFDFVKQNADGSWVITDQNPGPARTRTIRPSNLRGFVRPPKKALTVAQTLSSAQTYTVVAGDTLSKIAEKFGVTVDQLQTWNSIRDVNMILVGQRLMVAEPVLRYRVVWNKANIFTGPGTNHTQIGSLTKSYDDLTATGRRDSGWIEVASRYMREHSQVGWIWHESVQAIS